MPAGQTIRVRIAAAPAEARRLCTRLSRGGIPTAPDDGSSAAEVLVAVRPEGDLEPFRSRANWLLVLGSPGAAYFAAGADDVVVPGEPEVLFRRLRAALERLDLLGRVDRLNERVVALEAGLADAAHDVRSPLQVVIGNAELLARDSALTATQRECAEAAARQGLRALQLAERILEAAKQRSRAELEVEAVDVGELIEGAVDQAQLVARQRGVSLVAVPPARSLEIRAEGGLLARVLDNLIGNAIRVSPRDSQIEVAAWRASPRFVRLSVKDQGEGIAPELLPKLVAGLGPGRGLRIARDIAERHGGELWAESTVGTGSKFVVEIPLQPPSSRPSILLVSDDSRWLRDVSRTLKSACHVRTARAAGARLGGKHTDLVLLDPSQKQGKGLEALRSEAKGAQVPVIELPSQMAATRLARTLAHLAV